MTKQDAITKAIEQLDSTGVTQNVFLRGSNCKGSNYEVFPVNVPPGLGVWKLFEKVSKATVHAYRPKINK